MPPEAPRRRLASAIVGPVPRLSDRQRRALRAALPAVVALGALALVVRSTQLRASFGAAYAAFRDPARVHAPRGQGEGEPPPVVVEIDQPEIGGDFEPIPDPLLADAGP